MLRLLKLVTPFAILLTFATIGLCCLWDYDTLQMERQRFPQSLELITGKFLRHSPEFYQWRIENRLERLAEDANNLSLYDDLAVAYDKTDKHDLAIETILKKDALATGLYETYANLGTFHIHAGNLAEGRDHLVRAIEINPDAHFGREIYQQLLVEYVLSRKVGETIPLPLCGSGIYRNDGFAGFVLERRAKPDDRDSRSREIKLAIKGISGMMHFGNFDSPILLEALGDLLMADWQADGKRLAARAYLKASYEADDEVVRGKYISLALESIETQTAEPDSHRELLLDRLEQQFKVELEEAEGWYETVRAEEIQWIKDGVNVDEAFSQKYFVEPAVGPSAAVAATTFRSFTFANWQLAIVVGLILGGLFLVLLLRVVRLLFRAIPGSA